MYVENLYKIICIYIRINKCITIDGQFKINKTKIIIKTLIKNQ